MNIKPDTFRFYVCPKCKSNEIESYEFEYDDSGAGWKDYECGCCGFNWTEFYTFSHHEDQDGFRIGKNGERVHIDLTTGEFKE